jgi:hypothetical protein
MLNNFGKLPCSLLVYLLLIPMTTYFVMFSSEKDPFRLNCQLNRERLGAMVTVIQSAPL